MKTLYKNLKVSACSKNIISNANTVFYYIDSDFRNWNLDKESSERNAEMFAVLEMDKNATFKEIFTNLDVMVMTHAQIIQFVQEHKDKLNKDWYTFFLFKVGNEFFVAGVRVCVDGQLGVGMHRFSRGHVWHAEYRHRIVVPQLALGYFEFSPSDTSLLESRIKSLEDDVDKIKKFLII